MFLSWAAAGDRIAPIIKPFDKKDAMRRTPTKPLLMGAAGFLGVFCALFWVRFIHVDDGRTAPGVFQLPEGDRTLPLPDASWKRIRQGDDAIGFAYRHLARREGGYQLRERVQMRLNTQGVVQDMTIQSQAVLKSDFSLHSIAMELRSGVFRFEASAEVRQEALSVVTRTAGDERQLQIPISAPPYLASGVFPAMATAGLRAGERFVFSVFDPVLLTISPLTVEVGEADMLTLDGEKIRARRLGLRLKEADQKVWISDTGAVLKESGLLGIVMEKTTREQALAAVPSNPSGDIVLQAAIGTLRTIPEPEKLDRLRISLKGVPTGLENLAGERQTTRGSVVEIRKEALGNLPASMAALDIPSDVTSFLSPEPLIQSDHPDIQALAASLAGDTPAPLARLRSVVDWVFRHIDKRPVLSVPDALSTLRHGMGDCNEHAVLTAALARAAGLPAQVEVGLVYQEGRFYYHAWNRVFVGRWVTADAVFNQVPADVTHIRLSNGVDGLDMLKYLGVLEVTVLDPLEPIEEQP